MISIENYTEEYIWDLNNSTDNHNEIKVDSSVNGHYMKWFIYMVSTEKARVSGYGSRYLTLDVDLTRLKEEFYIILKNLKNETIKIIVKPNKELSRDRNYIFKLGKHTIKDGVLTMNVVSKENGKTEPWSVSYNGRPLIYDITTMKTKLSLKLKSILGTSHTSLIELTQDNSGKKVEFRITHDKDGTIKEIKAD